MSRFARALVCAVLLVMSLPAGEAAAQVDLCQINPVFCSADSYTLKIDMQGAGSGTVEVGSLFGQGPIAECTTADDSCEFDGIEGPLLLMASPDEGSEFDGFTGCQEFEEGVCGYFPPLFGNATVVATFEPAVPTLTVQTSGDGDGTVASDDGGIDCPSDCEQDYEELAEVTLTAEPDAASEFTGWSGACTGLDPCTVQMDQERDVTATFASNVLSVMKTGSGTGHVGSGDGGIDCGTDCLDHYASGTIVSLTATADPQSEFAQFLSGCGAACDVTVNGDQSETAVFVLRGPEGTHGLEADTDGSGDGFVSSVPGGIDCGVSSTEPHTDCLEHYDDDATVTLYANAGQDSRFVDWYGACDDEPSATCTVSMSQARYVNATFDLKPKVLTVEKTGAGTVTATDENGYGGLICGTDCTDEYYPGDTAALVATPDEGQSFLGWTNCDEPPAEARAVDDTCTVTMDTDKTVKARFTSPPVALTVSKSGTGSGTVTSDPGGIECGTDCTQSYPLGDVVTLTATPADGDLFEYWEAGACQYSSNPVCQVTVADGSTAKARFSLASTLTVVVTGRGEGSGWGYVDTTKSCARTASPCSFRVVRRNNAYPGAYPSAGSHLSEVTINGRRCAAANAFNCTFSTATDVTLGIELAKDADKKLTVTRTGPVKGTVTSTPAGIDCGLDCSHEYETGTEVQLTAASTTTADFTGWAGACAAETTNVCTVTMSEARGVSASFALAERTLTVAKSGDGAGTITSDPGGINCGDDCSDTYQRGTSVTLKASATGTDVFDYWASGPCQYSSNPVCTVTVDEAVTVDARFAQTVQMTITFTGRGNGSGYGYADTQYNCSKGSSPCTFRVHKVQGGYANAYPAAGSHLSAIFVNGQLCDMSYGRCSFGTSGDVDLVFELGLDGDSALTVERTGNGGGTVTSAPAGINCGNDCSGEYASGTEVTLTAAPTAPSNFTGWGGACSAATGTTCTVTMSESRSVSAGFRAQPATTTVTKTGTGAGTVTSSDSQFNCGQTCAVSYERYASEYAVLTATPDAGSSFVSWQGCYSQPAAGQCRIYTGQDNTPTATFERFGYELEADTDGDGWGFVTSEPAGISCGFREAGGTPERDCKKVYDSGAEVMLTANPAPGSRFAEWDGACDAEPTAVCTVTMSEARYVNASFGIIPNRLTVTKAGTGAGAVAATDEGGYTGLACGDDCSDDYRPGATAVLKATPASGSTFTGWTGCDTPAANQPADECVVTMDADKSVAATFTLRGHALTVTKSGDGTGTVTSSPSGIDCGTICSALFPIDTTVTLTATPSDRSTFIGFTGCTPETGAGGGPVANAPVCTVRLDAARNVTASFDALAGGGGGDGMTASVTPTPTGSPSPAPELLPDPSLSGRVNRNRVAKLFVGCGPVDCTVSARTRISARGKRIGRLKPAGPTALAAGQPLKLKLTPSRSLRRRMRAARRVRARVRVVFTYPSGDVVRTLRLKVRPGSRAS